MKPEWDGYATLLAEHFSGERAQAHVRGLAPFYRSPGSPGFDAAIDYILDILGGTGVEIDVSSFPLDGESHVLGAATPKAWEPRGGRLEITVPVEETLVTWDSCASCLPWWCASTPPEGAELELIDVGTGTSDADYTARDVAGKAVLVHDCGENFAWSDIVTRASRHGARGLVSNYLLYQYEPWRTRAGLPEAVQQMRMPSGRDDNPWTFTIDQPAFERVRELLASGPGPDGSPASPVVLRFTIDALTYDSTSRYVLATIPGAERPDECVLFVAHVSAATKPGANCASGVGLLLELARATQSLIEASKITRPRRSLRFLFGNETLCSQHWFEKAPDAARGVLGSMSFCSVGHDQGVTKSSLVMARSPDSLPTFLNDLVETLIEESPRDAPWAYRQGSDEIALMHWSVLPYTPWSDNATWVKFGVPALLFMSLPDRYFHTQLLTPEKTDPAVFRRCGVVTGAAALTAASASWPGVGALLRDLARRSRMRLDRLAIRASQEARDEDHEALGRTLDAIQWTLERDRRVLGSAVNLATPEAHAAQALADALHETNRSALEWAVALGAHDDGTTDGIAGAGPGRQVLRRSSKSVPHGVVGLAYEEMVAHTARMAGRDAGVRVETLNILADEIWNLSTGEWDIDGITRILGHEFSLRLSGDDVRYLAEGMVRAGYIELAEP